MSKNKKQTKHTEVYMQINSHKNEQSFLLRVPFRFKYILDSLMKENENCNDFHNSRDILQFFCELYTSLSEEERREYEFLLNSKIQNPRNLTDLIVLLLTRFKYYHLEGIDTPEKLGRYHILSARCNTLNESLATRSIEQAADVGKSIMQAENGRFYHGDYIGIRHTDD